MPRVTSASIRDRKHSGEKISVLTAYDYPTAKLIDECGVDIILVGDSMGMVVMGRPNTIGVTMDEMVHHTKMVSDATKRALVVADLPFFSYQVSCEEAVRNAGRLIMEGGAQAVKLEGTAQDFGTVIWAILRAGIPVMGHLGLMPQSLLRLGGYKIQGKDEYARARLLEEANELEVAGCFSIVLECVVSSIATEITQAIGIPTIGIGAGAGCDGQVLVIHDMLGLGKYTTFSKVYADVGDVMKKAFTEYVQEVKEGKFPGPEHSF